jgi:hypothetical protein
MQYWEPPFMEDSLRLRPSFIYDCVSFLEEGTL